MANEPRDIKQLQSISDFKNHPIYVLKSQLKKYEALNPLKDKLIGLLEGDEIHLREAVEKVRSKEAWLMQHACVIKVVSESIICR